MDTLVALCDILGCTPNDLIVPEVITNSARKTAEGTEATPHPPVVPKRSVVRRPGKS
jgi:hypothetical protein